MTKPMSYPNAPVTEAIIDLRVRPGEGIEGARLTQNVGGVFPGYPKQEELFETLGRMVVRPSGSSTSVNSKPIGWKFTSADQRQIVQTRLGGFTFSRLAPYESWEPFRDEARRQWDHYREMFHPRSVERIAVRYINRIDLPGGHVDLKEYLRTSPEIAPELPQQLEGFFMHLKFAYPEVRGHCLINQTTVPPVQENVVSVVLDIDLFRSDDIPQSEDDIWTCFESLHVGKNAIFEACITDPTRRLFASCAS